MDPIKQLQVDLNSARVEITEVKELLLLLLRLMKPEGK
jgi:hypothetical protein